MIDPVILRAMQAAGASTDVIIAAVEADAAIENERIANKRVKDAERQRRHRASRDVTVTERDIADSVTDPALSLPPNEINNSNPPTHTHPKDKNPARKGHRLSVDWMPKPLSEPLASEVGTWPSGAMERELARFRDWAASATGPNATKTDWDAAWRNWLRKAHDEGRYLKNDRQRSPSPPANGIAAALDRRIGPVEPAREAGRHGSGGSGGDSQSALARLAVLR